MRSLRSGPLLPLFALATSAFLTGWGASPTVASSPEGTATAPATAAGAFPVTIANTYGGTTIESRPERAATLSWSNQDVALALGVVPVGMPKATYGDDDGDGVLPWTYQALEKAGATGSKLPVLFDQTDGIPFEAVSNTRPDVVLAAYSGLTQDDFTTLSKIAPTVSFPERAFGTTWRETALLDGEALGEKAQAQAAIAGIEQQITEGLASHPDVKGKTFAAAYIDPSDLSRFNLYLPDDARVQFLTDLGLTVAPSVAATKPDGNGFFVKFASENIDQLADVDVLVTYGDDGTLATLQADPLIGKLPAVARGSVVVLPDGAPLSAAASAPSLLSVPWMLPQYLDLLQAAAAKV
ncbi:iron complex transport system substrate-binding protein [Quadrisphaera granulorum]|uniref:Iron complex transport system substrate-binding protein n=1 Tax=Quadrisphaera granulorum TaxID=317664 RepID=A0A315ZPZ4_9ACTN|nr:ABC transporter substrate-binding protein [Quadrisphaera granulorum]PWJ47379.1 iron complex transport system substrate-binding protein [Quadrisphaera granulorum]SZE98826.1 iron complex transport system substrate-binding protein [Quadrisphaera granulorum]